MSRTSVTYEKVEKMKCQYCKKLYMKPQCLQNHIIIKHSINISVPSPGESNPYMGTFSNGHCVFRQLQNIPDTGSHCSFQKSENTPSLHSKPSSSNSIPDHVSSQRKEIEHNPLFDIDVVGLPGNSQEKEALFDDKPFFDALDGIDFDMEKNAMILDKENIVYSHAFDQLQTSKQMPDQPLAVPEDDSLLFSDINFFEDLLTFE
ncbi:uncharacterized protein [Palaemon carinicauda]|uniref:uncharacterized protein n=1 Tax=Palaemon carinicauda TaxID=392227 RepID=UPI0035B5F187